MALIYEGPGLREPGLLSFRLLSRTVPIPGQAGCLFLCVSARSLNMPIYLIKEQVVAMASAMHIL